MALKPLLPSTCSCALTAAKLLMVILLSFNECVCALGTNTENKTKGIESYTPACEIAEWSTTNNTETVVLWTSEISYCNLLVTSDNYSRVAVRVRESFCDEKKLQYLYVERENFDSRQCNDKFLVYPDNFSNSSTCVTLFENENLRFHIKANLTLEIQTFFNGKSSSLKCPEDQKGRRCIESDICPGSEEFFCDDFYTMNMVNNVTVCQYSDSFLQEFQNFEGDGMEYRDWDKGFSCNIKCPQDCECRLRGRELLAECSDAKTWHTLIVYPYRYPKDGPKDKASVYLAHNRLGKLDVNAFSELEQVKKLFLHTSNITYIEKGAFKGMGEVILLTLSFNEGMELRSGSLEGLTSVQELYLENNAFEKLTPSMFSGPENIQYLFLGGNKFRLFESLGIDDLHKLSVLRLSNNGLKELPSNFCQLYPQIFYLELSNNSIQSLSARQFEGCDHLDTLFLAGNDLKWISKETFKGIRNVSNIVVDNYHTCCFITNATCTPIKPRPEFLTCKRLLPHGILRVCMWILGICALFGNAMVIYWRCREKNDANKVQSILIMNLSLSDLLMGVYMLILTCADAYFQEYFPSHANAWRSGGICKIAGLVALISSEASVFFLVLISVDRLLGVKYPFSTKRLKKKSTRIVASVLWGIALFIGMIATFLTGTDYYDVSEVCIGLPLARKTLTVQKSLDVNLTRNPEHNEHKLGVEVTQKVGDKPGMYFSIAIFIGVNFICFIAIALCYTIIFVTFHESTKRSVRRQERDEEIKMAGKMAIIVITDFLCWMPIVVMSMMVQTGAVILSPEMYAWTVTFILPINSSVNPFLYTISTIVSSRLALRKTRIYTNPTMTTLHDN